MAHSEQKEKPGSAQIDGDLSPLIKPQKYDLSFEYYETAKLFGGKAFKLVLWFKVITLGEYFDVRLPRYYNVKRIMGNPQKYGNFKIGAKCDFLREYANLFGLPVSGRLDRIPMSKFEGAIIEGKVRTVKHGINQHSIHEALQYSVIAELVKVKEI